MGVLHDYFRAPDPATAINWAVGPAGDRHLFTGSGLDDNGADWFDAKGFDPFLVLGQLVAFTTGVPFDARTGKPTLIWPDGQTWPDNEEGPESPWGEGPFVDQLPDEWITALAGIDDEHLPMLAAQWMDIPEIHVADFTVARESIVVFRALARRARDHGHGVFCRTVV